MAESIIPRCGKTEHAVRIVPASLHPVVPAVSGCLQTGAA